MLRLSSPATTSSPVVSSVFCLVDEGLLMCVSVALWMNGVPKPAGNEIASRLDCLW